MFRLTFNIDGEEQLSRYLDILADSINDFAPMFDKMADDFRDTMEGMFNSGGAFDGNSQWAPLAPSYRVWKAHHFPGRNILTLTGALKRSLTSTGGSHVEQITRTSMKIGTRDQKAIFHQRGTSKLPQRKIVNMSNAMKLRWVHIAHQEIFRMMAPEERASHLSGQRSGRR